MMTKQYKHQWYLDHKDLAFESARRSKIVRKEFKYAFVRMLKENPCIDCGFKYPHFCMDFDHRNPSQKVLSISRMINKNWGIGKIKEEINKCDLVCANCHRIRTYKQI